MNRHYQLKNIAIGRASRRRVRWMRWVLKPITRILSILPRWFSVRTQITLAGHLKSQAAGLPVDYQVMERVPCITLGDVSNTQGLVLLYLHGGGFLMPAMPKAHVGLHARLCRDLGACGVMPDYRLAPLHPYPAALDDCEMAYQSLLSAGFKPENILLAGESAGGNLVLGLLQRIRKAGLPMPACAVPISPVTEVARVHAPPSRRDKAKIDAMLPIQSFSKMILYYAGQADGSDPELSPIFADFQGFPPLYFIVGEDEILLDDSLIAARQARKAGVETSIDVWPVLPHAFPLMEGAFCEAAQARKDIFDFMQAHTTAQSAAKAA